MCLLGKFLLPWNGSLITAARYTTNVYFANEKYPPWRLPGEQEVRQGAKQEYWRHTGPGSNPHFLSPQMYGLGEAVASPSGSQLSQRYSENASSADHSELVRRVQLMAQADVSRCSINSFPPLSLPRRQLASDRCLHISCRDTG